jgi:hypothetical protein
MAGEVELVRARRVHQRRPIDFRHRCLSYKSRQRCLKSRVWRTR